MDNHRMYKKIEQYVKGLFEDKADPSLVFHNLKHTQMVVERAKEIAGHYRLSEKDMLIVFAAAWFHDTGYLFTEAAMHEDKSVQIMKDFMAANSTDNEVTDAIEQCILATKIPRNPSNILQHIICDADTYHFGTKDFKITNKLTKQEYRLRNGELDKADFNRKTIEMLEGHQYYTGYCKDLLSKRKQKNMKKLKKKTAAINYEQAQAAPVALAKANNLSGFEKDKGGLMSKGIQTMLRLTSENHLKLSDMADNKANILISVNAIIISVILTLLVRKLQEEAWLTIPTIIFLTASVATIVISIIATRPKISGGTFSTQDILDKKTNLLFFGNFYRASYEEYDEAMRQMMLDTNYLYGSLIKDIYSLGTVLGRKYKLIRLAYNIFMVGIVVSVIAFAVAVFFYNSEPSAPTIQQGTGSPL